MDPGSLNENAAFLVGEASQAIINKVKEAIKKTGKDITIEQFTILSILWYDNGLSQQDIANRANRDKTTITRIINNMEKNNLVVRIPDKNDKRVNYIHLTHNGKSSQQELARATGPTYYKSIEGFDQETLKKLNGFLRKMINNLK